MPALRLALDWTPNTNHTGFFTAQALGYYAEAGIALEILHPGQDNYQTTPARKLLRGQADIAVAPSESAISLRTKEKPAEAVAIAAILQQDLSGIAVLKESGIQRPAELAGRKYASYGARYEDQIVKTMVANDLGSAKGQAKAPLLSYPSKLGIWDTLLKGQADATWIFTNWEGVAAEQQGIQLRTFRMEDYGIPYGYSPVLLALGPTLRAAPNLFRRFLKASAKGFQYAAAHPQEAVSHLAPHVPSQDSAQIDLLKAQQLTGSAYLYDGQWGYMAPKRVEAFGQWLKTHHIEPADLDLHHIFSNEWLNG